MKGATEEYKRIYIFQKALTKYVGVED